MRHLSIVRPLAQLTAAEKRIKQIEPRNFRADPWLEGEGPRFFTPARVAQMAKDNEALRAERSKRKRK